MQKSIMQRDITQGGYVQKGITQIGKKASSTKALCKKATHKQEDCKKLKIAKKKAKNKKSLIIMDTDVYLLKTSSNVQSRNRNSSRVILNIPRVTFLVISCLWQFKTVTLEMTLFRNIQFTALTGHFCQCFVMWVATRHVHLCFVVQSGHFYKMKTPSILLVFELNNGF